MQTFNSVFDVMDTLEEIMASPSRSTKPSSASKAEAAMAAEAKGELVLFMLTTHTSPEWCEGQFARVATRLFGSSKTIPQLLTSLVNILKLHQQFPC